METIYNITHYRFQEINYQRLTIGKMVIDAMETIANELRAEADVQEYDYLKDELDYGKFIHNDYDFFPDFGCILLAKDPETDIPIGFMLCFDDYFKTSKGGHSPNQSKSSFPFNHCSAFFLHDIPFLRDLDQLGGFAYCFQIGVARNYQKKGCASQLLDYFERLYGSEALFLAASIHEKQTGIIRRLKQRNREQLPRHLETGKDYYYLFLDHYFEQEKDGHWFRVIQILDNKQFVKKINFNYLPNTYNTVIPVQLNQAVLAVNKIIKHLDAKMLWSSFFNASDLLRERYGMGKDNHGFFESLLDAKTPEQYEKCTGLLREITRYLKEKDSATSNVVSLTESFKKNSYELFFFNDDVHEMSSFNNPMTLSLTNPAQALNQLFASQGLQKGKALRALTSDEKRMWFDAAQAAIKNPTSENLNAWEVWKEKLLLTQNEIEVIENGINSQTESHADSSTEQQRIFKKTYRKIKQHPALQELPRTKNRAWFDTAKAALKSPAPEKMKAWEFWKEALSLTPNEIEIIENAVTPKAQKPTDPSIEQHHVFKKICREINLRKIVDDKKKLPWQNFFNLHQILYNIDASVMDKPSDYWWCHAMVPINYSRGENMVGIMFSFRCKKLPPSDEEYAKRMDNLANLITSALSKNMLNILIKLKEKDAMESANRYGIAAVTSRNLAHNLGSHILTNLDTTAAIEELQNNIEGYFPEEMARFHGFIRTKTNLLADMVTSEPVSTVNKWLKKEIIDEFNKLEIVKKYISGTHIAEVNIRFRDENGSDTGDISVQIPNGDLGVSAFYMLLENIIRNSAKYENTADLEELTITVKLDSSSDRGHFILLYDHIAREKKELDALVESINDTLNTPATRLGIKIKSSGSGLIEMKAAAAYLRKKVPGIIIGQEEDSLDIKPIEAISHPLPSTSKNRPVHYTLAYRIYLKRPRNVILINHKNMFSDLHSKEMVEQGIKIISQEQLIHNPRDVHSHSFVLYFEPESRPNIEKYKRFPLRWILLDSKADALTILKMFSPESQDELLPLIDRGEAFLKRTWAKWIKDYCKKKQLDHSKIQLYILESQDQTIEYANPDHLLIFDLHGSRLATDLKRNLDQLGFYQAYTSVDPTGRILNSTKSLSPTQQETLRLQLLEAAITKVLVIDERIQRDILRISKTGKEGDFFAKLRRMLIYVPDPGENEPNLFQVNNIPEVEQWLVEKLTQHKFDFVVLHLGLLESWLGSKMENISNWIDDKIRRHDDQCEIILISGRGKPHQFPPSVTYQPASTISEYIVGGPPSKFHLVQVLFSSRTRVGLI